MRCEVPITCQGGISDSNLTHLRAPTLLEVSQAVCGPALPVVAVTPPSPSSTPTQGQSWPRLYFSSDRAAVLVPLPGR